MGSPQRLGSLSGRGGELFRRAWQSWDGRVSQAGGSEVGQSTALGSEGKGSGTIWQPLAHHAHDGDLGQANRRYQLAGGGKVARPVPSLRLSRNCSNLQ